MRNNCLHWLLFAFRWIALQVILVSGEEYGGNDSPELTALHIGGVFPMEAGAGGWPGGQACLPAVKMALDDLNSMQTVLPGYTLNMYYNNSKCQPGLATTELYDLLYKPPVKLMLLAGCSPVTTVIAEAAPVWRLVVLSYGASSPALSNRKRFETLFRTHPSANMQNPTRIKLIEKYNWKRITILQSVEEVFTSTAKDLEESCKEKGIRAERQSFYGDPTDAVRTLVRQDARIIFGLFYVTEARRVLCQAYKQKLVGPKHVWFLIGWYADTWYLPHPEEGLNCTSEQMTEAAQYHFTTESIMLSRSHEKTISGMSGPEFERRLTDAIDGDPANTGGFPEAPLAYDAVWALALAFNCTMRHLPPGVKLEHFTYDNEQIAKILFECVKNTSFRGVSGNVMFSDSGDRIARTQIEQLQDGKYVVLGYYDNAKQELEWHDREKWHGYRGPPPDSTIIKKSILTVAVELYYLVALFVVVGLFLFLLSFIFNTKYGYRGVIVQSQPQCNNVFLAGCALSCASLLLMGLPAAGLELSPESFPLICHSRISILMVGFTFAYGSMFAKVWIVHRIGASENQQIASRQKDEPVAAVKFYVVIVAFFVVDVVIVVAWIIIDPLQRIEQRFPLQDPADEDEDIKLLPVLELCQSEHQHVWTGIILGYKCLLLVFGLFFSYESRNLKLRYVNDSRFVGLAIYNVALLALIIGPTVTLLIRNQANANFAFTAFTVILCTYISLGLIFVPKIRFIMKVPPSRDEVLANGNGSLTKAEQKRFEQVLRENESLDRQLDDMNEKIGLCQERLAFLLKEKNGGESSEEERPMVEERPSGPLPTLSLSDDDNPSVSSPTTLTTTALIELQPSFADSTGRYMQYEEMDNCSSSSDEILL